MTTSIKKIAIFLNNLEIGGVEKASFVMAKALAEKNYQVDFVVRDKSGPMGNLDFSKIRMHDLNSSNKFFAPIHLAIYLIKNKPDVLFTGYITNNAIAIIANMLSGSRSKLIISERGAIRELLKVSPLGKKILFRFIYLFYRFANEIVAVSQGILEELPRYTLLDKERITLIYNPVVNNELLEKGKLIPEHKWFHDNSGISIILYVGRLHFHQKDLLTLLEAFALLIKTHEVRLLIVGDGEDRSKVEEKINLLGISKYVDLTGKQINPFPYMSNSTMLVLPSFFEGLPNVLIEAMALRCQVISTDCPYGPREILDDGKYGILTPIADINALKIAMAEVLDGKIVPKEKLEERAWVFSVENSIKNYLKIFFN